VKAPVERNAVIERMQDCLNQLGIPLEVCWTPNPDKDKHGEIILSSKTLLIYATSETEAWQTLTHEIFEFKFKRVCESYRTIINSLIEALEKVAYQRKEEFLEFLPQVFEEVKKYEQKGS
jgi:hypothetical protein